MNEPNPNGRFTLTPSPTQFPGVDFFTRSPNGPFVDTGTTLHILHKNDAKSLEHVYLSIDTVREMAVAVGLFDGYVREDEIEYPQETDDYLRGYADAMKERITDDVVRAAELLGFTVDRLGALSRLLAPVEPQDESSDGDDAGAPAAPDGEDDRAGEDAEGDGAGQPEPQAVVAGGQKPRASRKRRSHDVSGDSGDEGRAFDL